MYPPVTALAGDAPRQPPLGKGAIALAPVQAQNTPRTLPSGCRKAFPAHGEFRLRFFFHRQREAGISAAVENPEDQRKPDGIFGHRKADRGTALRALRVCGG